MGIASLILEVLSLCSNRTGKFVISPIWGKKEWIVILLVLNRWDQYMAFSYMVIFIWMQGTPLSLSPSSSRYLLFLCCYWQHANPRLPQECRSHHGILLWVESGSLYLFYWSCSNFSSLQKSSEIPWASKNRLGLCLKGSTEMNRNGKGGFCFLPVTSIFYWTSFSCKMYKQVCEQGIQLSSLIFIAIRLQVRRCILNVCLPDQCIAITTFLSEGLSYL